MSLLLSIFLLAGWPHAATAQPAPEPALRIVNASPEAEIASLAQANEIRVVFSEPMVTVGSIPARVTAPFFRVTPAIPGTFRWSGTTVLIFTPDPKRPLPYATKYDVTIDTMAVAVSGRRLTRPHTFSFTTPTVRLLSTDWYRREGRAGARMVVLLRFNQPVRAADVAPHLSARFESHTWRIPALHAAGRARLERLDPSGPPFSDLPPGDGTVRRLNVTPDRIQSHGLDISGVLENGTGLLWAAVRDGEPIPRSRPVLDQDGRPRVRASVVQVTNLGITVKDSPQNTLVFVTRLDSSISRFRDSASCSAAWSAPAR